MDGWTGVLDTLLRLGGVVQRKVREKEEGEGEGEGALVAADNNKVARRRNGSFRP